MYGGNGISVYHDTENDDWIISWKYGDVIAGYGLSSYVDEYQYLHLGVNESALTGISSDNQQKMFVDDTVQTSAFVLGYNKDYDIFTNTIQTNDGVLNVNPLSGIEDIEEGKTATFEHWITPSGNLTGITFASGQTFIG
ncbi:MAG: hypothetical protein J6S85_26175 [Methanobrevibacter sp.]|nr:hypothetical protein [Methanobrevibacter sp.]MBO7717080.1 hypothetical protein [Methanobrevibacter sp.]